MRWKCEQCEWAVTVPYEMLAEIGTPICANCDIEMTLMDGATTEDLVEACQAVLKDHDERVALYGDREPKPARVLVMENLRNTLRLLDLDDDLDDDDE
jgi:hypothetical protein